MANLERIGVSIVVFFTLFEAYSFRSAHSLLYYAAKHGLSSTELRQKIDNLSFLPRVIMRFHLTNKSMFKNPSIKQLDEFKPEALMDRMNFYRSVISIYPLIFIIAITLGFIREPSLFISVGVSMLILLIGAWRFGATMNRT